MAAPSRIHPARSRLAATAARPIPKQTANGGDAFCQIAAVGDQQACSVQTSIMQPITTEEVLACQCELLAYTTALNEVAGISVFGGPPYECGNVNLQNCPEGPPTTIPTLNEYGMIITAGVLGLLAVIGLFVMRRRKVSA